MSELHFFKKRRRINYELLVEIAIWTGKIALVLFLAWFVVDKFGLQTNHMGDSMSPNLENGEQVLVNKMSYLLSSPERDDIIAFHPNGNEKARMYIRRVIGLPGERVQIKKGKVYIDGKAYNGSVKLTGLSNPGVAEKEIKLAGDEYFVLSNDGSSSEDSRVADIGNVKKEYIEGKVWFIISPKSKLGFVH